MRHIYKLILAAFISMATLSCDKESSTLAPTTDDMNISINASISKSDSEDVESEQSAIKSEFAHDDQVSVFAWTSSLEYSNLVVNNVALRLNYDVWVSAEDMEWKNTTSTHTVAATYPAVEEDNFEMLKVVSYESGSDVLHASVELAPQTAAIDLEFKHVMALLDIELTYNDFGEDDAKATSITLSAYDDATINYYTGAVSTDSATKRDVELTFDESGTSISRIMVPQSGINDLVITIGDKQYQYSGDEISLEPNCRTSCKFVINKHFYTISLGEVSVNDWSKDSGNDFDFSVSE